jgi:hypothetical protein
MRSAVEPKIAGSERNLYEMTDVTLWRKSWDSVPTPEWNRSSRWSSLTWNLRVPFRHAFLPRSRRHVNRKSKKGITSREGHDFIGGRQSFVCYENVNILFLEMAGVRCLYKSTSDHATVSKNSALLY